MRQISRMLLPFFELVVCPRALVILPLCTGSKTTEISGDLRKKVEHFSFESGRFEPEAADRQGCDRTT